MVSTLLCKAEILPAEQQSYFSGTQFEYLLNYSANWLTLTMHSMLYVVIAFAEVDVMEMFAIVAVAVVVDVDLDEMLLHLKWATVVDKEASVGSVRALFDN